MSNQEVFEEWVDALVHNAQAIPEMNESEARILFQEAQRVIMNRFKNVGNAAVMPSANRFTMAAFDINEVPDGAVLYILKGK